MVEALDLLTFFILNVGLTSKISFTARSHTKNHLTLFSYVINPRVVNFVCNGRAQWVFVILFLTFIFKVKVTRSWCSNLDLGLFSKTTGTCARLKSFHNCILWAPKFGKVEHWPPKVRVSACFEIKYWACTLEAFEVFYCESKCVFPILNVTARSNRLFFLIWQVESYEHFAPCFPLCVTVCVCECVLVCICVLGKGRY